MSKNAVQETRPPELRRDLGLLDAVGVGVGAIIGAGIFVVTGVAAAVAGPAFLVGLAIAGIAATANALSSAELAVNYPQSGGTYEYGYRVLNPWFGFVAGWMFLASKISAAGTVALGLAGYLDMLVPWLPPRTIAVGAILLFTVVSYFGVRKSSQVNLLIVLVSVSSLLLFVGSGVSSFRLENLSPFAPTRLSGILEASAILFFAYTGYARIATLAEEVRNPVSTIPRAVIITLVATGGLYLAVSLVAVGAVGSARMAATAAPLWVAAEAFSWPWVSTVVAIGGVTAMLGVVLSQLLGLSRMVFAMARYGDLPSFLKHVHPRHRTPNRAVLVVGLIAAVVAATGTLASVASAAAFTILVYYGIANLAALRLERTKKLYPHIVAEIGLVSCTLLALSLPGRIILIGCLVLLVGVLLRVVFYRKGVAQGDL